MRLPSHCGLMRHLISLAMHFKNIKRHDEYQWSSWQGIYYMKYQEAFQFSFLPFRTSKGTRVTTGNAWKGLGHQRNSGWNIMNKEQKCVKKKKKYWILIYVCHLWKIAEKWPTFENYWYPTNLSVKSMVAVHTLTSYRKVVRWPCSGARVPYKQIFGVIRKLYKVFMDIWCSFNSQVSVQRVVMWSEYVCMGIWNNFSSDGDPNADGGSDSFILVKWRAKN